MDDHSLRTATRGGVAFRTTALVLTLAASLAACKNDAAAPSPPANQAEVAAAADAAMPTPAAPMADATVPTEAEATITIPDDVDAIWAQIDQHQAELATVVASGNLAETHHHAFAIRDLFAAVPAHAAAMSAEDKATMDKNIAFAATLAGRLDSAGDAGDRAGAQASYAQLAKVLEDTPRTK